MESLVAANLNRLADLIERDPHAAADEFERQAAKMLELARALRSGVNPMRSTGGMTDRVQMEVWGPDGRLKQRTDTGER